MCQERKWESEKLATMGGGKKKVTLGNWWDDTYLVGLNSGDLLIDRNSVTDLLLPRLQRAL
jgi:hypothetical protein